MTTNNKLTPPAPLDPTKPHHPAEHRQWQAAWQDYHDALRAEDEQGRLKRQAAEAHANRVLTEDEYYEAAVKRHAEAQAKLAERQAADKAKQDAEDEYLASLPDTAEVLEASEFILLLKLQNWFAKGYELTNESIRHFIPGCYAVTLTKPATAKRSK